MSLQRILNNWYGVNKQMWRLVYRASTHGYSADAFHRHCDGVAPTYTIVMVVHIISSFLAQANVCSL